MRHCSRKLLSLRRRPLRLLAQCQEFLAAPRDRQIFLTACVLPSGSAALGASNMRSCASAVADFHPGSAFTLRLKSEMSAAAVVALLAHMFRSASTRFRCCSLRTPTCSSAVLTRCTPVPFPCHFLIFSDVIVPPRHPFLLPFKPVNSSSDWAHQKLRASLRLRPSRRPVLQQRPRMRTKARPWVRVSVVLL